MRKNGFKVPIKRLQNHLTVTLLTIALLVTSFTPLAHAGLDDANLKEVAIEWVSDYAPALPNCGIDTTNLPKTDDDARGWYTVLGNNGFTKQFEHGDTTLVKSKESDFEKAAVNGQDSQWADNVDMIYFAGHGRQLAFTFAANNDGDGVNTCRVWNTESQWGDKDMEWIGIAASNTLSIDTQAQWTTSFKDLHGMAGFNNSPFDSSNIGGFFACYMTGSTFGTKNCGFVHVMGDSWKQATIDDQASPVEGAVLRGLVTINGADRDYWTDFADNMWPDPPNGQYKLFLYTKWLT